MASRLSWRRMPRRVTLRWLVRRNRTHTTTPDYSSLPDEVIEQILLKLKCIKSIVTCTSVCKSCNLWNIITTSGPSYLTTEFFDMVHVNGTLYWLTSANRANWSDERKDWKLTSLTLKNGMFRETLIWPVERSNSVSFASTLGACSDSIFVLRVGCDRTSLHVYDESLNELHRNEFEKSGKEVCRVLGVRSNGIEVLFQKFGTDPPILVFDVGELKLKEFCPSAKTICRAIPFVETLVLLDDGDSRSIPKAG
ncbi:hypothetical protein DCAR_0935003 [Daucus carota subsp. sativus]|uniref:Uncharacterized protein n=1 Tax=Daucus carota subsp. sativus TaxID=79200 RepID=A0A175YG93_DAUCS|nr:hypothetical protein DCAR_0935003 [Daucus carota subsp. sativus]